MGWAAPFIYVGPWCEKFQICSHKHKVEYKRERISPFPFLFTFFMSVLLNLSVHQPTRAYNIVIVPTLSRGSDCHALHSVFYTIGGSHEFDGIGR